jgi:hypothetical protein
MKSSVLWDITECSPVKVNLLSEEHIVSKFRAQEKVKQEASMKQAARLLFDGGDIVVVSHIWAK